MKYSFPITSAERFKRADAIDHQIGKSFENPDDRLCTVISEHSWKIGNLNWFKMPDPADDDAL